MLTEAPVAIKRARMPDLDDTWIGRGTITRIFGMVMGKIRPSHLPDYTIEDIAQMEMDHNLVEGSLGGFAERFSYWVHSFRKLYPEVASRIKADVEEGVDIIPATGRSSKEPWPSLTEEQIASVRPFVKRISYTPRGVKTAVSKVHTAWELLQEGYEEVRIDEDDPRTAEFERKIFAGDPRISVNYIQYPTTSKLEGDGLIVAPNLYVTPGLYETKPRNLEDALFEARLGTISLGSFADLVFLEARLRTMPSKEGPFKRMHKLLFDRALARFEPTNRIVKIADSLAGELPLDGLSGRSFRDGLSFRLSQILADRLSDVDPVLAPRDEEETRNLKYRRFMEFEAEVLESIDPAYKIDSMEGIQKLGVMRSAGSVVGKMLVNQDVQVRDIAIILNSYVSRHNSIKLVRS